MLSKTEKNILKKIAERHITTKAELKDSMRNELGSNPLAVIDMVTRNLLDKKFISVVSPVGSTCYVITQKGTRFLESE